MTLYDQKDAVNARRVRMFLAEKGLTIPAVSVDIRSGQNLSSEYLAINPTGLVPALETDEGEVIGESIAICRYIEALEPSPNLFGFSPIEVARIEAWERRMEREGLLTIAQGFRESTDVFTNRAVPGIAEGFEQIPDLAKRGAALADRFLSMLDHRLTEQQFVAGERFTVADITAFVSCGFAKWIGLKAEEKGPGISRWYAAIKGRPSASA